MQSKEDACYKARSRHEDKMAYAKRGVTYYLELVRNQKTLVERRANAVLDDTQS